MTPSLYVSIEDEWIANSSVWTHDGLKLWFSVYVWRGRDRAEHKLPTEELLEPMILLESYQMIVDTLHHSHFVLRLSDSFYYLKRLQLTAYTRPSHSDNVDGLSTATLCLNSLFHCRPPRGRQSAHWVTTLMLWGSHRRQHSVTAGVKRFLNADCQLLRSVFFFTVIVSDVLGTQWH